MDSDLVHLPPNAASENSLNDLLVRTLELGASDMFIMGGTPVTCRVGSELRRLTDRRITDRAAFEFAKLIYGEPAQSLLGAGDRIDATYDLRVASPERGVRPRLHRWRVNIVSCVRSAHHSCTITMRPIASTPPSIDTFDIPEQVADTIVKTSGGGLGLVVGPTGSGKTTTMAACLGHKLTLPGSFKNLVTIEHPIEFLYDQLPLEESICTQMEVGKNVSSFEDGIENAMRMTPTDIMLGEIRSFDTISSAIQGSMTGHFVLSTLHANSVPETLQRIKTLYPAELQHAAISEALQALKLICAQRRIPSADGGTVAIREYLVLDHQIRTALSASDRPVADAFEILESHGHPMIEDIRRIHAEGRITDLEYQRQVYNYDRTRKSNP